MRLLIAYAMVVFCASNHQPDYDAEGISLLQISTKSHDDFKQDDSAVVVKECLLFVMVCAI